jgi:hypothetical protein
MPVAPVRKVTGRGQKSSLTGVGPFVIRTLAVLAAVLLACAHPPGRRDLMQRGDCFELPGAGVTAASVGAVNEMVPVAR